MTNARPEKDTRKGVMPYEQGLIDGSNQRLNECMAYTDDLLRPLEELVKKYSDENYVGISATIILNHISEVLVRHKDETGEREA